MSGVLKSLEEVPRAEACLTDTEFRLTGAARQEIVLLQSGPTQAILITAQPLSQGFLVTLRDLRSRVLQKRWSIAAEYAAAPGLVPLIYQRFAQGSGGAAEERTEAQKRFDALIREGGEVGASDIHLILKRDSAEIRFRIHGALETMAQWTRQQATEVCACAYTVLADNREPTWDPSRRQDANIARAIGGRTYRVRYAHHPIYPEGVHIVLRLLSTGRGFSFAPSLEHLGYAPEQAAAIEAIVAEPSGMIILSGETGSGKSTTLANLMHVILQAAGGSISLQTVEDPPEYEVPGVLQSPVVHRRDDRERGLNPFADAIIGAMRCDPDILVVGEIRDLDTALLAISMTESGHPVLGTLHARRALGIIPRLEIIGAGQASNPISRSVLCAPGFIAGLIHQSLLPVLCGECRRPWHEAVAAGAVDASLAARVRAVAGPRLAEVRTRGPGCRACRGGIRGRTVCAEVVVPDAPLLQALVERRDQEALDHWLGQGGGYSIRDHAIDKMCAGLIAPEDVEGSLGRLRRESKRKRAKVAELHGEAADE